MYCIVLPPNPKTYINHVILESYSDRLVSGNVIKVLLSNQKIYKSFF